jgi:hypothetical protein
MYTKKLEEEINVSKKINSAINKLNDIFLKEDDSSNTLHLKYNSIFCNTCNTIAVSSNRHHFSSCYCNQNSADGGDSAYLRRVGNSNSENSFYKIENPNPETLDLQNEIDNLFLLFFNISAQRQIEEIKDKITPISEVLYALLVHKNYKNLYYLLDFLFQELEKNSITESFFKDFNLNPFSFFKSDINKEVRVTPDINEVYRHLLNKKMFFREKRSPEFNYKKVSYLKNVSDFSISDIIIKHNINQNTYIQYKNIFDNINNKYLNNLEGEFE